MHSLSAASIFCSVDVLIWKTFWPSSDVSEISPIYTYRSTDTAVYSMRDLMAFDIRDAFSAPGVCVCVRARA